MKKNNSETEVWSRVTRLLLGKTQGNALLFGVHDARGGGYDVSGKDLDKGLILIT